jgi:hypothetical protein
MQRSCVLGVVFSAHISSAHGACCWQLVSAKQRPNGYRLALSLDEQDHQGTGLAGRLSTEARLGLALSEFVEALDGKHRAKFNSLRNGSNVQPSGWEEIQFTEEINREGSRLHR